MLDFARFTRVLLRSEEIAVEQGMRKSIVRVYNDKLAPAAAPYLAADAIVTASTTALNASNEGLPPALDKIDLPYQEARIVAFVFIPGAVLPETLKSQPTDTDKISALDKLMNALDEHKAEPWAAELLQGEFGTQAASVVTLIRDGVTASKNLAAARTERQAALPAAYDAFIQYKRLVRTVLGSASKQYQRIHVRELEAKPDKGKTTKGTAKKPADPVVTTPVVTAPVVTPPTPAPAPPVAGGTAAPTPAPAPPVAGGTAAPTPAPAPVADGTAAPTPAPAPEGGTVS